MQFFTKQCQLLKEVPVMSRCYEQLLLPDAPDPGGSSCPAAGGQNKGPGGLSRRLMGMAAAFLFAYIFVSKSYVSQGEEEI